MKIKALLIPALCVFFFISTVLASPADVDDDGKDDLIVFNPSTSTFTIRGSTDVLNPFNLIFGSVGDTPTTFRSGPGGESGCSF